MSTVLLEIIVGIIDEKEDMFSALASNFPAGTLSGAPKIEAMKIINEIEDEGRGPYGGAIGQFSFNGDCTFAIPIRSIFIKGNKAFAQTCGGNVYDSDPKKEYLEIERKLKESGLPNQVEFLKSSLSNLNEHLAGSVCYIGNDTGLKHICIALGVKTFTFFGPEPPLEWHPYDKVKHPYYISISDLGIKN